MIGLCQDSVGFRQEGAALALVAPGSGGGSRRAANGKRDVAVRLAELATQNERGGLAELLTGPPQAETYNNVWHMNA